MKNLFKTLVVTTVLIFSFLPARPQNRINNSNQFDGYADINLSQWLKPGKFSAELSEYEQVFNNSMSFGFDRLSGAKFDLSRQSCGVDISSPFVNPSSPPAALKIKPNIYRYASGGKFAKIPQIGSPNETFTRLLSNGDRFLPNDQTYLTRKPFGENNPNDLTNKFGKRDALNPSGIAGLSFNRYAWNRFIGNDPPVREDSSLPTPFRRIECATSPPEFIKQGIGRMYGEKTSRLFESL